jgi:hypothetical protein
MGRFFAAKRYTMSPVIAAICCFIAYFFVYRVYARFLGRRIFALDPLASTPAHDMNDGVDYVPTTRAVLFGHHYASIAGLAPMLGPAIAVIWGWLPGMLWVVFGTLFIGAVHDFGALVVSMRNRGLSIGKVAEDLIGHRAKFLFLLIILFLICLVMGVFVRTVAGLFTVDYYPESAFPTFFLMAVAMVIGWLRKRHHRAQAQAQGQSDRPGARQVHAGCADAGRLRQLRFEKPQARFERKVWLRVLRLPRQRQDRRHVPGRLVQLRTYHERLGFRRIVPRRCRHGSIDGHRCDGVTQVDRTALRTGPWRS